MKPNFLLSLMLLVCLPCCAPAPAVLVARIEWQAELAGGTHIWRDVNRQGELRGSIDETDENYFDYMDFSEKLLPEEWVAEIWDSAAQLIYAHQAAWQEGASYAGEGYEQLTISFCHSHLGWQMLSFSWPAGEKPQDIEAGKLFDMLKDCETRALRKPAICEDLLHSNAPDSVPTVTPPPAHNPLRELKPHQRDQAVRAADGSTCDKGC